MAPPAADEAADGARGGQSRAPGPQARETGHTLGHGLPCLQMRGPGRSAQPPRTLEGLGALVHGFAQARRGLENSLDGSMRLRRWNSLSSSVMLRRKGRLCRLLTLPWGLALTHSE